MRVLVTRPDADARETVARLQALGHTALAAPMLSIDFCPDVDLSIDSGAGRLRAWLVTSRNGVRALARADASRRISLFAVGRGAAALARAEGFSDVRDADGDVGDLAALIAASLKPDEGVLFHAAGRDIAGDLAGALTATGFTVERRVLYSAEAASALPVWLCDEIAAERLDAALFFSARSACIFAALAAEDAGLAQGLRRMLAVCISRRAAACLPEGLFGEVRRAAHPDQDALLDCLAGAPRLESVGRKA